MKPRKFFFPCLLITCVLFVVSPLAAQDDLYGDKRVPKEKERKTKVTNPYKQKTYSSKAPVTQTIIWNDSVSAGYALIFISRRFETNKLPVRIFQNDMPIGDLERDSQFNYKVFSTGPMVLKVNADGITRQHTLNIQKGQKYYLDISMMNSNIFTEVNEEYALEHFRPSSVKRISENLSISSASKEGATGFFISQDGYIITNFLSLDNAKTISVKGVNGNFQNKIAARMIAADKANNIALVQLDDSISLPALPYAFKSSLLEVGDSIYILAYNTTTSGVEIKTTRATILSRSSSQGDINGYEISTPRLLSINGAPVFDTKGNIIGIVNTKSRGGMIYPEATKIRLVESLLSEMGRSLPAQNNSGKSTVEITPLIQNNLVLIEAE